MKKGLSLFIATFILACSIMSVYADEAITGAMTIEVPDRFIVESEDYYDDSFKTSWDDYIEYDAGGVRLELQKVVNSEEVSSEEFLEFYMGDIIDNYEDYYYDVEILEQEVTTLNGYDVVYVEIVLGESLYDFYYLFFIGDDIYGLDLFSNDSSYLETAEGRTILNSIEFDESYSSKGASESMLLVILIAITLIAGGLLASRVLNKEKQVNNDFINGMFGALLGTIVAALPWIIVGAYFNYYFMYLGLLFGFLAVIGYKAFGGRVTAIAKIAIVILTVAMVLVAETYGMAIILAKEGFVVDAELIKLLFSEEIFWEVVFPNFLTGGIFALISSIIAVRSFGKEDDTNREIDSQVNYASQTSYSNTSVQNQTSGVTYANADSSTSIDPVTGLPKANNQASTLVNNRGTYPSPSTSQSQSSDVTYNSTNVNFSTVDPVTGLPKTNTDTNQNN